MKTIDFDGRDYKKLDYNTLSDLEKKYLWEHWYLQYITNPYGIMSDPYDTSFFERFEYLYPKETIITKNNKIIYGNK